MKNKKIVLAILVGCLVTQNVSEISPVAAESVRDSSESVLRFSKMSKDPLAHVKYPKKRITTAFAPLLWTPSSCGALSYSTSKSDYTQSLQKTGQGTPVLLLQCAGKFMGMSSEIQFQAPKIVSLSVNEQTYIGQIKATKLNIKDDACVQSPVVNGYPVVADGTNLVVGKCSNSRQRWGYRKTDDESFQTGGIELYLATAGNESGWEATGQCLDVETVTQSRENVVQGGPVQIWKCTGPGFVKQDQNSQNISTRKLVLQQTWSSEFLRPTNDSFNRLVKSLSKSDEFAEVVANVVRSNDGYVKRVSIRMLEKYASKAEVEACKKNSNCKLNRLKSSIVVTEGLRDLVIGNVSETTTWVKQITAFSSYVASTALLVVLGWIFPIPDAVTVFQPKLWTSAKAWATKAVELSVNDTIESAAFSKFLKELYVQGGRKGGPTHLGFCLTAFSDPNYLFDCQSLRA
jgi:hypothetical protein